MENKGKLVFGAILALVLIAFYAATLGYMIAEVVKAGTASPPLPREFPTGILALASAVGGLISAVVVATLGITKPADAPTIRRLVVNDATPDRAYDALTWIYLAVWLVVGLASLVVGVFAFPKVNQTLYDLGMTWVGLAVAAVYAYFGIRPHT